ncbi:sex hormone-binding globulin isoform X2 [Boleophthalmus pectinirostris]|uniref:sex hormone-binding globulin isoform X2 n=1 Tax=Boleophthalmus pectinirostris TaxID=150288 RepID=UPI00242CAEF5|nr:sex hormone-binding globulin isoform X2 [Boleophthalmus pectinirostris]
MGQNGKTIAGSLLLILGMLGQGVHAQGNGRGKKEISGAGVFHLGQDRDMWRPLIQMTVNLSEVTSIKSTFQLRTFDPEGTVFYGDTKGGEDWFVLSLKEGFPLMQISKENMLLSVAGGPKLNDGKWHTLEVSNQGKFVVLVVDRTQPLVVGLQPKVKEESLAGVLRLAVGGILINKAKLLVQYKPQIDGCVREGNWLNLSTPWETEEEEMWPCHENIKPGSYFVGKGFAVFNYSVLPKQTEQGITLEFWGDMNEMEGTICSIKNPDQEPIFHIVADKITKLILTLGSDKITMKSSSRRLRVTFLTDVLTVHLDEIVSEAMISVSEESQAGYSDIWTVGSLSIGGLLGEDNTGSHFLTGCLEKIQIQGKNLDMNLADKEMSINSHSCPA